MTNPTPEQIEARTAALAAWQEGSMIRQYSEYYMSFEDGYDAALVAAAVVPVSGLTSDGHHTFDELYDYRMLYNVHAAHGWLAAGIPVVKAWKHSDGELCFGGGWFIVTATLPTGQVSNHYKAEHWGLFAVPEVNLPPEYDGHTPQDAAERLRAAAGVTPRERGEVLQRAHEVIEGVYANELRIPAYMLSRQAALALKQDDLLAAPVQVDEAKLAEVIEEHQPYLDQTGVYEGYCVCGEAAESHDAHLASVLAGWLRGGGQ